MITDSRARRSAPADNEAVRSEALGLLGDWALKALSVVGYLAVPSLVTLAVLVAGSGVYAALAGSLVTAAAALLVVAHRPWRHAAHRADARKKARAQQPARFWRRRLR
ncbi:MULTISPECIES: hypothetical protein [unclassified Streptomyces]|uniref:hypothetical protein n=1 Tax=unclassified Streptomyces TaxID=2593676 RepID=UPI00236644F5|nr:MULTISPECIES: hypothetical protein [unclassified Streptomyces]MDF3141816.1 hypothetical protein [Streptomyces sp. T21Q-yed]WDF45105.1 hypothetical protein PBV52_51310 [Streptomyces sp. T12]